MDQGIASVDLRPGLPVSTPYVAVHMPTEGQFVLEIVLIWAPSSTDHFGQFSSATVALWTVTYSPAVACFVCRVVYEEELIRDLMERRKHVPYILILKHGM